MNEDKIIEKIIKLEEDVESIKERLTKLDMLDTIMAGQDKMIQILQRVDHERIFTNEKIKHLETDLERIKLRLQIA